MVGALIPDFFAATMRSCCVNSLSRSVFAFFNRAARSVTALPPATGVTTAPTFVSAAAGAAPWSGEALAAGRSDAATTASAAPPTSVRLSMM